jgi:hypothetical protein
MLMPRRNQLSITAARPRELDREVNREVNVNLLYNGKLKTDTMQEWPTA